MSRSSSRSSSREGRRGRSDKSSPRRGRSRSGSRDRRRGRYRSRSPDRRRRRPERSNRLDRRFSRSRSPRRRRSDSPHRRNRSRSPPRRRRSRSRTPPRRRRSRTPTQSSDRQRRESPTSRGTSHQGQSRSRQPPKIQVKENSGDCNTSSQAASSELAQQRERIMSRVVVMSHEKLDPNILRRSSTGSVRDRLGPVSDRGDSGFSSTRHMSESRMSSRVVLQSPRPQDVPQTFLYDDREVPNRRRPSFGASRNTFRRSNSPDTWKHDLFQDDNDEDDQAAPLGHGSDSTISADTRIVKADPFL